MISDDCSLPAGTIAPSPHIYPIPLTDSTVWRQPPPFLLRLLLLFLICHLPFLPSMHELIPFYLLPTFGLGILPMNVSLTNLTRIFGARKTIKTKLSKRTCRRRWGLEINLNLKYQSSIDETRMMKSLFGLVRILLQKLGPSIIIFINDESKMLNVFFISSLLLIAASLSSGGY